MKGVRKSACQATHRDGIGIKRKGNKIETDMRRTKTIRDGVVLLAVIMMLAGPAIFE